MPSPRHAITAACCRSYGQYEEESAEAGYNDEADEGISSDCHSYYEDASTASSASEAKCASKSAEGRISLRCWTRRFARSFTTAGTKGTRMP